MSKWIGVVIAAVFAPHVASAGVPAWCKGNPDAGEYELKQLSSSDVADVVGSLAKVSCSANKDLDSHRGEIDSARAAWGKKLGMVDADWADALEYAESDHSFKADFAEKGLDKLTPVDQFKATYEGLASDPAYVADALEGRLTEAGRLGFLMWCLKDESVTRVDGNVAKWAACQEDIDKLDITKLGTELHGDTAHDGAARMWLRVHGFATVAKLKELLADKAKLIKKDDEYGKVFEVAKKAREEWHKTIGSNTKLLDLVSTTDSGVMFHSRKLLDGCEEKTTAALAAAVATVPAKKFTAMHDDREDPYKGFAGQAGPMLAGIPLVHTAAIAYAECQPKSGTGDFLADYIQRVPGWRGPRNAAITAISSTQFKFDDTNTKPLEIPNLSSRPYNRSGGSSGSAGGVVKSTKVAGEKLEVNLEKTTRTVEMCVKSHRSNTAWVDWGTGRVTWEMDCDESKPVQQDTTWLNFKVAKRWEKTLKPGVAFSANYGRDDGDVLVMWPSKTAKLPSWVLGATVK